MRKKIAFKYMTDKGTVDVNGLYTLRKEVSKQLIFYGIFAWPILVQTVTTDNVFFQMSTKPSIDVHKISV